MEFSQASSKEWLQMLQHISERKYFTRVWTIQECILAQKVDLFCGRSRVPLNALQGRLKQQSKAVEGVASLSRLASFLEDCGTPSGILTSSSQDVDETHNTFQTLQPATAIARYAFRQCKDPRDKIFGLHSLMVPTARARITIDYKMPLFDILLGYIGSHEYLLDRGAQAAHQAGHGHSWTTESPGSLGEVMLSIRVLVHQFLAASPEFRKDLKEFCVERHESSFTGHSHAWGSGVAIVVCPVQYHKITARQSAVHDADDILVDFNQKESLNQLGLRPAKSLSNPSSLEDRTWRYHEKCGCCDDTRYSTITRPIDALDCLKPPRGFINFTSCLEAHRLLCIRSTDSTGGLVFQVPKETIDGDVVLSIGSGSRYVSFAVGQQRSSYRQFVVCRKKTRPLAHSILGAASHVAAEYVGAEPKSRSPRGEHPCLMNCNDE